MTLDDLLQDIYALEEEMRVYERKYSVLSETFHEAYNQGEEPAQEAWVRDWTSWASACQLWLRRRDQYKTAIRTSNTTAFPRPVSPSQHPTSPF